MAMVALSGPLSNITLAVAAVIVFKVLTLGFVGGDIVMTLLKTLSFAVIINLALAIFNLIPVYPLDGSQVALGVLKGRWLEIYERHIPYGVYIIMGLVVTGLFKYIVLPPLGLALLLLSYMGIYIG
jgi:Zn-dependent protease